MRNRAPLPVGVMFTDKQTSKLLFADYLRANQTPSERLMARVLFHLGIDAAPQVVIRGWIVDFYDYGTGTIIEVDGSSHQDRAAEDQERDAILRDAGYRVIRVSNEEVVQLMASFAEVAA